MDIYIFSEFIRIFMSCSKLHSAILFSLLSCIRFILFNILLSYIYMNLLSNARLHHLFSYRLNFSRSYSPSLSTSSSMFSCISLFILKSPSKNIFRMISSTACWTKLFTSCSFPNVLLYVLSCLHSL